MTRVTARINACSRKKKIFLEIKSMKRITHILVTLMDEWFRALT